MKMSPRMRRYLRGQGLPFVIPDDPRLYHEWQCDFEGNGAAVNGFNGTTPGGGAMQEEAVAVNHPGVNIVYSSGSATGMYAISHGYTSTRFGGGWWLAEWVFYLSALATVAQDFTIFLGFQDATTTAGPVDGAGVKYTQGTNSGKFQYWTRSNSTESTVDSGLTVAATTWYRLLTIVNPDGTVAYFSINGEYANTLTTNIPTAAGRETGLGACLITTAGTGTHKLYVDYARSLSVFNAARTL